MVVSVTASTFARARLGKVSIPEAAFSPVQVKAVDISDVVKVVSASLWKTEADGDGDSRVEAKVLVQNLTDKWLPQVKVSAEVPDKSGRELCDAGGYEEVRPGAVATISGSGYTKYKKLVGATAEVSLGAYIPVAAGATQMQGLVVTAPEVDSSDEEDESDAEDVEQGEEVAQGGKRDSEAENGSYKYRATIDTSFILEAQEAGDKSWSQQFSRLQGDADFPSQITKYLTWDLDCNEIKDVELGEISAGFSDVVEGAINVSATITFRLDREVDDWESGDEGDALWELKNGLTLHYQSDDEEFKFLAVVEDAQVEVETL